MTNNEGTRRTAGEVREYLLQQVNSALRRPGMFGGEVVAADEDLVIPLA